MSGGHWDFGGFNMVEHLREVAQDEAVIKRFPKLSKVLDDLSDNLYQIEHDLDWDLSGDFYIENDEAWEKAALQLLASPGTLLQEGKGNGNKGGDDGR